MPRLIPHDEVMSKLAALQSADQWGRQFAGDRAVMELAKTAGALIAQSGDADEAELEKYAMSMVDAGERLTMPGRNEYGRVIAKLPTKDYHQLPELERAAMQLAEAAQTRVAQTSLVPVTSIDGLPEELLAHGEHALVVWLSKPAFLILEKSRKLGRELQSKSARARSRLLTC